MLRSKLSRNLLAIVPLIIAIVSISERFILYTEGTWLTRIYRGTDTHADGLLIGATLALTLAFGIRYRKLFKYLGIIFLLLSLLYAAGLVSGFIDKNTIYQGGFTLLNLLFAYLIYRLITNPMTILNGILSFKPLVFIGKISYGIYLFHFPIMTILHGMFSIPSYITIPFTILFSMFSYRYIESPFLRLKDRLCRIDSGKISPDPVLKEYFRIDSGKIDSDNPV